MVAETPDMERVMISGVSLDKQEAKLSLAGVPDVPGIAAKLFTALADCGVNVDMIVQSVGEDGLNTISFTVQKSNLKQAVQTTEKIGAELGAKHVDSDSKIAKVSAVGAGMRSHSGVAAKMFRALGDAGINIHMISTSEIKLSCVVDESRAEEAVQVVHEAFKLGTLTVEGAAE